MRIGAALLTFFMLLPMTGWVVLPIMSPERAPAESAAMDACARACARMGMVCPMMKHRGHSCECQISPMPKTVAVSRVHATAPEQFEVRRADASPATLQASRNAAPLAGFPDPIDHPPTPSC